MLYYISYLIYGFVLFQLLSLNLAVAQQLPQECGKLDENLLYNRKTVTALNEYPWLGLLGLLIADNHIGYDCVAVLISQRYIIAPAHCLEYKALTVAFGNWRTDNDLTEIECDDFKCAPPPKIYYLEEINPHFQFSQDGFVNDMGLAKLKENVEFSEYIQPICLPPAGERPNQYIGQRLELAGYSIKNQKEKQLESYRLKTSVHVPSFEYCINNTKYLKKLSTNQMCGYVLGNKTVLSGSALMGINLVNEKPTSFYLMGIASFGVSIGSVDFESHPIWFQRISPFRDLILQNIT